MSEAKHTTGPWQVMNHYNGATTVIGNVDGETFSDGTSTFSYDFVCDTMPDDSDGSRSREVAVANARLIAAAPDLLKALKAVMAVLRKEAPGTPLNNHKYDQIGIDAYAAISKAKGVSPDE